MEDIGSSNLTCEQNHSFLSISFNIIHYMVSPTTHSIQTRHLATTTNNMLNRRYLKTSTERVRLRSILTDYQIDVRKFYGKQLLKKSYALFVIPISI